MGKSSVMGSSFLAGGSGLLVAGVLGAAWVLFWFYVSAFIAFLFWPKWEVLIYLNPPLVIPLLYLPFLAKAIALHLGKDAGAARITLLVGIAAAVVATWWLLVRSMSGWEPTFMP